MQWDDLRYFLAAARMRTLSAAAVRLGVDATTVGRRLDRLSSALNTTLFEQTPAGLAITDAGEKLLAHAEEVERSVMTASSALTGERSRLAGTVRISLSEGFAGWIVARNLRAFHLAHPDITLEIATANGFLNPSKREADLAVMLARPSRGPLVVRKLTDYSLGLFATPGYVAEHGTPDSPDALRHHSLIGYIPDLIYSDELRYLNQISDGLRPQLCSSSIYLQYAMTRTGAGIAVLPHFIGRQDPDLIPLLDPAVRIRGAYWTVVHRDLRGIARVDAVIAWLDRIVAEHRHHFMPPE